MMRNAMMNKIFARLRAWFQACIVPDGLLPFVLVASSSGSVDRKLLASIPKAASPNLADISMTGQSIQPIFWTAQVTVLLSEAPLPEPPALAGAPLLVFVESAQVYDGVPFVVE